MGTMMKFLQIVSVNFILFVLFSFQTTHAKALEASDLGGKCTESPENRETLICGEGESAINIVKDTAAPPNSGLSVAVGWRAPEREDWPFAELYLVNTDTGEVVQNLKARVRWGNKTQLSNHQSVIASWMGKETGTSGGFVMATNGKWETESVQIFRLSEQGGVIHDGEALPMIGGALYNKLYEDNPDVDLSGYVLSLAKGPLISSTDHKQSGKPFTVIMTAIFEEPKASTPIYEYEMEITLDRYKSWSQPVVTSISPLETN